MTGWEVQMELHGVQGGWTPTEQMGVAVLYPKVVVGQGVGRIRHARGRKGTARYHTTTLQPLHHFIPYSSMAKSTMESQETLPLPVSRHLYRCVRTAVLGSYLFGMPSGNKMLQA